MAFKKGERVKWVGDDNREHHGTVVKGGRAGVAAIEDGGIVQVKGTVDAFARSDKPAPAHPPSVMDKYTVEKYKTIPGGHDSQIFNAVLCENETPIASVTNHGHGGSNFYQPLSDEGWKKINQAQIHAADWAKENGVDDPVEALDLWVDWAIHDRPYGKTADEFLRPLREARA